MKTSVCAMFGLDAPIFAFSHCRDVVVAASRAGGMGVFGALGCTPEQLEVELSWIDARIGGKPYAVDLVMPNRYERVAGVAPEEILRRFPESTAEWIESLLAKHGVPPLAAAERDTIRRDMLRQLSMTPQQSEALLEVALRHPCRLIANALGTPARHVVEQIHAAGRRVASLVGALEHVKAQLEAGVDLLIAQGYEAGGHTGTISTMVLTPQVVDLVSPLPVLAAGGIASGRQMAAALALGAQGVWCGSIWLGTVESETDPLVKQRIFASGSKDAVITKSMTGKTMRAVRSGWTDAWNAADAPSTLQMPLQSVMVAEALTRIRKAGAYELTSYPAGQVIGQMTAQTSVREVFTGMLTEYAQTLERLETISS
jgi:NAD(P)H-dependent flavin oxidoreductase YrpB (nitropropane dioxygenase family)